MLVFVINESRLHSFQYVIMLAFLKGSYVNVMQTFVTN